MAIFNDKTQEYIDNALQTLNIWFASDKDTPTPTPTPTPTQGGGGGGGRLPRVQEEDKPNRTTTYIVIGASVLIVGGIIFYVIKRKK